MYNYIKCSDIDTRDREVKVVQFWRGGMVIMSFLALLISLIVRFIIAFVIFILLYKYFKNKF